VEGENQPLTGIVMRLLDDVLPVSYLKCCHRNDASSLLVTPLHSHFGRRNGVKERTWGPAAGFRSSRWWFRLALQGDDGDRAPGLRLVAAEYRV